MFHPPPGGIPSGTSGTKRAIREDLVPERPTVLLERQPRSSVHANRFITLGGAFLERVQGVFQTVWSLRKGRSRLGGVVLRSLRRENDQRTKGGQLD